MTINSFGTLMQSTLPLFDITLNITDKEFATVSTLVAGASVGLLATGGAGLWMWTAGAATGPVGLLAVTGISTLALGTAAIREGLKWGERQKNNRSYMYLLYPLTTLTDTTIATTSLITIQKVMEECARFLLALLFIQAEMSPSDDATHLERVQQLKSQLSSGFATNKNYQKAYFKNTAIQLAKEMKALEVGLENGTV
jgi:hypothetical protein